jgi:hypothetical protein
MPSERIDYFYSVSGRSEAAVLVVAALILFSPFVYLGARISWLITDIGSAIFTPVRAYVGLSARSKRIRSMNPAPSLLEDNFSVSDKDKTVAIAYNALKSVIVEIGGGFRDMASGYFSEGHMHELTFDTIGLTISCDSILESLGAYDTRLSHAVIAERGAIAIIPSRKNAPPWKENRPGAAVRNDILRAVRRFGRTLWKKWSGYHCRSLVETKTRCFKLLGERVMARDFDRQVAELQIRAALLNRFTHLGAPLTVRVA